MRRILGWIAVVALCCAAGPAAEEQKQDPRLQEAQTAYDEAQKLNVQGKYAEAVAQGEHALALREAVLGGSHPEVAHCLDMLGGVLRLQGDLDRAEPLIQRGLAIREETLGKSHPLVAQSLNNLANVYVVRGSYAQAESLHQRALAIREEALGKNHPLVATSLNNLAILYDQQGFYSRAEPLYQRALTIREEALGKLHHLVATSLSNLAILYSEQGLFGRAEPLYQRALAIRETTLGAHHPDFAGALSNLANVYHDQGLYAQAEPLYQRALAIKEAALGENHPDVAISLYNLAIVYSEQGLYGRAEPLYQRSLAIRQEAHGKNHPLVAQSLHGLANLYARQKLHGRAEPLYRRALAISEETVGKNHPDVALSLSGLADLYAEQGLHGRAEPLYRRALAIREEALGKNHPHLTQSLNGLALLKLAQHRLDAAVPLFTRAFSVSEQRLRHEALDFSESRLAHFLQFLRTDEERLYALLRAYPDNASVRRLALSAALLLKGRSVEETADISRAVYRSMGTQEHDTFERLRALRMRLAQLSLQGLGSLPPAVYQQQLQALAKEGDALEAELARRSAPLRALAALPSSADIVDRVAQALPRDGALVEFITYEDRPLLPGPGAPKPQLRSLALVLFPDATTRALDLGPAGPITAAASHLRTALANRDATFQAHAQALYTLAFRPLLPLLGKTRHLFLSPDGQLTLVPFAALHDGRRFLADTFDFTYLTSGKDLLPRSQESVPASSVVVLADPDFSAPRSPPAVSGGEAGAAANRSASVERFFSSLREDPAQRAWSTLPLPGTRLEAEAIQRLLPQAQLFLGSAANKERLLHLPTPGILHLATHGFFLDDAPASPHSRAVGVFGPLGDTALASRPPDPLLRSGLILAGARSETSPQSSASPPPPDSALVTALELAGLDLWGTQLVVLSACDTGRGDVTLGQGVYGLRRAFIVAGAETVVMSLWQVKDDTTSELMGAYYRNLLAGRGRALALREAMLSLRATRPHPHYWAPFIAVGRDTPLRELEPTPRPPPEQ
ncbi:tetratricopeptide repeat protein [Archangium gephyra]|uniref:Kinesin light chain-like protein n=1 Tax=Archangium gephyra TaxID=48 RepID=A0AAC8Q439_9BACT|nr:CHAT domain-containing tetratricopeptide repeat protein [Archangium gephyra]AKJ00725.1 kinesin light chain-like protein [Archangium gephyra]REG20768.1 tetratricopeptide repeat protein [Archangium gephyra]